MLTGGRGGVKFAKILLMSYVNAPMVLLKLKLAYATVHCLGGRGFRNANIGHRGGGIKFGRNCERNL